MAQSPSLLGDVQANLEHLKRTVKENKYEDKIPCAMNFLCDLNQLENEGCGELLKKHCIQTLKDLEAVDTTVDEAVVEGFKKLLEDFLAGGRPPVETVELKRRSQSMLLNVKVQAYKGAQSFGVKGSFTPSSSTTKDLKKESEQASGYTGHEQGNESLLLKKRTEELEELSKMYGGLEEKYKELETVNEKLKYRCTALEGEKKKMMLDLSEKQKMITHFESRAEENYVRIQELETLLNEQFCENERLQKNNGHLEDVLKANERTSNERIKALTKQRDDLINRYSKLAGQKLKDNNSDITDLSDPNRPMKLGEKLSELYDNEWTDAFQVQVDQLKKSEKEAIQFLLQVLEECYKHCREMADKQMEMLKTVFFYHGQDMTKAFMGKEKPRLHSSEEKALLEVRKLISASKPGPAKQSFLPEIAKKYEQNAGVTMTEVKTYFEKCVEVCWLLAVNDPPLYMDTVCKQGAKIDQNLYTNFYTPGDKADFVVWPPLFSHQNGGLINKGVIAPVQEKKKIKK